MAVEHFEFAFDPRFVPVLAAIGVRPASSEVVLGDDFFEARFGPWRLATPTPNLKDVQITRGYRWFRAVGVRGSLTDRGATFGTNARAGVCVCFHEPVAGVFGRLMRHPALTVTVADPEALAAAVRRRISR